MKILVTGSNGFIGKSLCYYIESEMDIIPYTLELSDFYNDTDWSAKLISELDIINPDIVFHIGASSDTLEKNVNYMMEVNYESTKIISDWTSSRDRKMIYSSSAANYGINNKFPSNLYGWSKYVAEGYVISNGGVALRYFNVYGPGESHKGRMSSVAFQMHTRKKKGDPIYLFPGKPERDFIYIKDAISANIYSMRNYDAIKSDWYDVGSFESRTFEDVLLNMGISDWEYSSEDWIPEGYQYFTKAIKIIPGWKPKYTIESGLKEYMKVLNNE
jgi:ADP-L-glycero-D-manno-heptose 6-epimerase